MEITYIKRIGEDWIFKAISKHTYNSSRHKIDLIYGITINKGIEKESFETYTGSNYIPDSNNRSYSTHVDYITSTPLRYRRKFEKLVEKHKNTNWEDIENE